MEQHVINAVGRRTVSTFAFEQDRVEAFFEGRSWGLEHHRQGVLVERRVYHRSESATERFFEICKKIIERKSVKPRMTKALRLETERALRYP